MQSKMARSMAAQALVAIVLLAAFSQATAKTVHLEWSIKNATFTRNCATVTVATVNGMSPGPTVEIMEGDTLVVKVTNDQVYDVTMHWHGIKQFGTNYADGPAYITQCPIKQGESYTYEFTVIEQSGTFWYHAHITWLRSTVHGALIVHPKKRPPYGRVEKEIPIILAEWFGMNPNVFEAIGFLNRFPPLANLTSITPTINGLPGPLYGTNCTPAGMTTFKLKPKKTYLLRLINAALNDNYYFRIAGHKVTVVGADGNYLKPFRDDVIAISPGQTFDLLLITSKTKGKYYFGFNVGPVPVNGAPPPTIAALGMFEYDGAPSSKAPVMPKFPNNVTIKPVDKFVAKLKNAAPYSISKNVDVDLIYVITTSFIFCNPAKGEACQTKIMGSIQNYTFDEPRGNSILQAYANGVSGVYTQNLPDHPPSLNISVKSRDPNYGFGNRGTNVKSVQYGDVVQVVLQNAQALGILDHPFHLHGHDFYVVGRGYGVYDPAKDPAKFNLVNPPMFNTYALPNGGWVAFRFKADNPGVWFFHCHFERHKTWGMMTAFIVGNGGGKSLQPPLHPLPSCAA